MTYVWPNFWLHQLRYLTFRNTCKSTYMIKLWLKTRKGIKYGNHRNLLHKSTFKRWFGNGIHSLLRRADVRGSADIIYAQIPRGPSRYDTTRYLAHAFWHRKTRDVLSRVLGSTARHARHDKRDTLDTQQRAQHKRVCGTHSLAANSS